MNCERLKIVRAQVRSYLDQRFADYLADEDPEAEEIETARNALRRLASDLGDRPGQPLPAFISVLRDFFGPNLEGALLPNAGWEAG